MMSYTHPQSDGRLRLALRKALVFSDAELISASRGGFYDLEGEIPSFQDFDRQRREEIAENFDVSLTDTYFAAHDDMLRRDYSDYVAGRFARGAALPNRLWRTLDYRTKRNVAITVRGRLAGMTAGSPESSTRVVVPLDCFGDPYPGTTHLSQRDGSRRLSA